MYGAGAGVDAGMYKGAGGRMGAEVGAAGISFGLYAGIAAAEKSDIPGVCTGAVVAGSSPGAPMVGTRPSLMALVISMVLNLEYLLFSTISELSSPYCSKTSKKVPAA